MYTSTVKYLACLLFTSLMLPVQGAYAQFNCYDPNTSYALKREAENKTLWGYHVFDQFSLSMEPYVHYDLEEYLMGADEYLFYAFAEVGVDSLSILITDVFGDTIAVSTAIMKDDPSRVKVYMVPPVEGRYFLDILVFDPEREYTCVYLTFLRNPL